MEDQEKRSIIESLLFIAGEPLALDTIVKTSDISREEAAGIIEELKTEYMQRGSGIMVVEVAEGIQMVTNPASAPWVKKLIATAIPTKLSNQSLETLSIIAYKQPIIKSEVEAIRGVNSDGVVKTLLERRMIKILGRKEAPGRPLMYGTTKEFLQYFGLKDLSELPTLKDFEEEDSEGLFASDMESLEILKEKGKTLAGDPAEEAESSEGPKEDIAASDEEEISLHGDNAEEEEVAVEPEPETEPEPSRQSD